MESKKYEGNKNKGDKEVKKIEGNENRVFKITTDPKNLNVELIKKNMTTVTNYFALLGHPGSGKSSFCALYYHLFYKLPLDSFETSLGGITFTKGLWTLTEYARRQIENNIEKDIIDAEGFLADEVISWKYVICVAFVCTDIIILKNDRLDGTKHILGILKSAMKKMQEYKIPYLLKNVLIQAKQIQDVDAQLKELGFEKKDFGNLTFKLFRLQKLTSTQLFGFDSEEEDAPKLPGEKEILERICKIESYVKNFKTVISLLSRSATNSVSTILEHIDKFNKALNGEQFQFDQGFIKYLEEDFERCYLRWEMEKRNDLCNIEIKVELKDDWQQFLTRNSINDELLSFKMNKNHFSMCVINCDETYDKFAEKKTFKLNAKDVFGKMFENKQEGLRLEDEKKAIEKMNKETEEYNNVMNEINEHQKIFQATKKKKQEMDNYFEDLKFKEPPNKRNSFFDLSELSTNKRITEYQNKLKFYFNEKIEEKGNKDKMQIKLAQWIRPVQACGNMTCENGCKLLDEVVCRTCKGGIYWIDGPQKYAQCINCQEEPSIVGSLNCSGCGAKTNCIPKWVDYIPIIYFIKPKTYLINVEVEVFDRNFEKHYKRIRTAEINNSFLSTYDRIQKEQSSSESNSVDAPLRSASVSSSTSGQFSVAANEAINFINSHIRSSKNSVETEYEGEFEFEEGSTQIYRKVTITFSILGTEQVFIEEVFVQEVDEAEYNELEAIKNKLRMQFIAENFPQFATEESKNNYIDEIHEEMEIEKKRLLK